MRDLSPTPQLVNSATDRRRRVVDRGSSILDPARSPRGRDRRYYVSAWPGLKPEHLLARADIAVPFPFNAVRRSYFYVARNAIYHLFRALRLARNETVLVPDYHSGNEVGAIRAAGASIRFYRITRSLQPDLEELERLCSSGARVLYLIHFLGWPQPLEEAMALARDRNMIVVEDCALSLLSQPEGRPLGSAGDYAVYCLYKTLPVPNGGLLVQNRDPLRELDRLRLRPGGRVSVCGRVVELMVEWIRSRHYGVGTALSLLKRSAGRFLTAAQVSRAPVGDIGFDIGRVNIGMSPLCHRLLKNFDYEWIVKCRRENFQLMLRKLSGRASLLLEEFPEGVCPLFFPILVPRKREAAQALEERGINVVQFWNHGDREAARLHSPHTRFLRDHVLELPIHQDVTPEQAEYVADQVLKLNLHVWRS